jgi:hypothetical protein
VGRSSVIIAIAPLLPVGHDNDGNNRNPQRDDDRAGDGRHEFGSGHALSGEGERMRKDTDFTKRIIPLFVIVMIAVVLVISMLW